jgi:RNA processing factor Prp31
MIVQAIALLDDLDKEINIYSMRVKVRFGSGTEEIKNLGD